MAGEFPLAVRSVPGDLRRGVRYNDSSSQSGPVAPQGREMPMTPTPDRIKDEIRERFANVALSPQGETKFPVGPDSAKRLGYDPAEVDALPGHVT